MVCFFRLFLILATCGFSLAFASDTRNLSLQSTSASKRVALVIGNDSYQKVDGLRNARADARAIAKALEANGFAVTLRLDQTEKATKDAVRRFKAMIVGGDEAVFYFSGHGVQLGGANYLLPIDIAGESEEQVKDEALSLQRVLDDLQDQKARFSLAIIDACRNNPFKGTGRSIGGRGLAPTSAATGQMVLFAAGSNQQALDKLDASDRSPNGLFTRVLLKQMAQPGISVDRMLRGVRDEVVRLAKSVGHEQVPALYDQAIGDFYFRPANAAAVAMPAPADTGAAELAFWDTIKSSTDADDFQVYLDKYPNGQFVALAERRMKRQAVKADDVPPALPEAFRDCVDCPDMIVIPAGSFEMGGTGRNEGPVHRIALKGFALGRTEVTQGQWRKVMGNNPSHFSDCGDNCPVEKVSWEDAQNYMRKLSQMTGQAYRLPSEAEWEYACRAGGKHNHCGGNDLYSLGWAKQSFVGETQPVAGKQPNAWNLYDMSGNVWEWVADCWNESYGGAPNDGSAWLSGNCSEHVARGVGYGVRQEIPSAAMRQGIGSAYRDLGFRAARTLPLNEANAVAAPSSVAPTASTRGQATIYFFRPSSFIGSAVDFTVKQRNRQIGQLVNGSYFSIQSPAGKHLFSATPAHAPTADATSATYDIAAGNTYYIEFELSFGIGRFQMISAEQGNAHLGSLRQTAQSGTQ